MTATAADRSARSATLADLAFDPAAAARLRRGRSLLFGVRQQARAIGALMMREALTRYGNSRIGYLWAVIEPTGYIAVFVAMRAFLRESVPIGENVALFVMSGIVAARVAVGIIGKTSAAIESNRALLVYPLVNPLDAVAARCVLESLTGMVVTALFFIGLLVFAGDVTIQSFPTFTTALAVLIVLSCSIGAFNAVLGTILPAWSRLSSLMALLLFITSGAFFVPATLPLPALAVVWWNPLLHVVEWVREGIYLDYLSVREPFYPLAVSAVLLGATLTLERLFRLRVVAGT